MKFIDFVGTNITSRSFVCNTLYKIYEETNTEENSLSWKIYSNFLRNFLYSIAAILTFALHASCISISSKYSIIKTLCSSTMFTKQELRDHPVSPKDGMFLKRSSVKVNIPLLECDVKVAIPFKLEKVPCILEYF